MIFAPDTAAPQVLSVLEQALPRDPRACAPQDFCSVHTSTQMRDSVGPLDYQKWASYQPIYMNANSWFRLIDCWVYPSESPDRCITSNLSLCKGLNFNPSVRYKKTTS